MLVKLCLPCLLLPLVSCAGLPGPEQKPVPLHNATPHYPPVAELHGRSGFVALDCTITEKGEAQNCAATDGDHDFVAAALAYMHTAKYRPSLRNGVPVAYTHYTLGLHFKATAPRPITIPVHCHVPATGIIGDCHPDVADPPFTWPIVKSMAEGTRIIPNTSGARPVDDPARALLLVFAYVRLPWFGPEPRVEGDVSLSELLACERHSITPTTVSLACRMEDPASGPAGTEATEHLRAYLGIKNGAPPPTGDFGDPSRGGET